METHPNNCWKEAILELSAWI